MVKDKIKIKTWYIIEIKIVICRNNLQRLDEIKIEKRPEKTGESSKVKIVESTRYNVHFLFIWIYWHKWCFRWGRPKMLEIKTKKTIIEICNKTSMSIVCKIIGSLCHWKFSSCIIHDKTFRLTGNERTLLNI